MSIYYPNYYSSISLSAFERGVCVVLPNISPLTFAVAQQKSLWNGVFLSLRSWLSKPRGITLLGPLWVPFPGMGNPIS